VPNCNLTFCDWPWTKIKISPSGDIANCCFQRETIGNILNDPIEKWWHGSAIGNIRKFIEKSKLSHYCDTANCPYQTIQKKKFLISVRAQPKIIELELPNTGCNIGGEKPTPSTACIMCARALPNFKPNGEHFLEVLEKVKPLVSGLSELWLVGLADSFWKNQWFDVLNRLYFWKYCKSCKYHTFSNGIVLNTHQSKFLDLVPISSIIISIDAASSSAYKKIRRLDAFETVVKNVQNYANDPRRSQSQHIGVTYNINLLNIDEVSDMVSMWKDIDVICVAFTSTYSNGSKELKPYLVNKQNVAKFIKARDIIHETAAKLNMNNVSIFNPLEMTYGADSLQLNLRKQLPLI
jgi:MoaA/NifB/PqqE/SkfB family radical SAM enzyme